MYVLNKETKRIVQTAVKHMAAPDGPQSFDELTKIWCRTKSESFLLIFLVIFKHANLNNPSKMWPME